MKIKQQHYVWRYYLQSWAEDNNFHCLRQGNPKPFPVTPFGIAKEKDFYRLREMTEDDIKFIELFAISRAAPHLQSLHKKLVESFYRITKLKTFADKNLAGDNEFCTALDEAVNNAEEMLHGRIEDSAKVFLDALKNGDTSFFPNHKQLPIFLYFICVQHFRTKGLRDTLFRTQRERGLQDFDRIWNVLSHIFAANVGWSFYAERHQHHILVLENGTNIPFLTGDQPTVNIHSNYDGSIPERLAFYYPVSPKRAILLMDEPPNSNSSHKHLTALEVEHYNSLIVRASHEMLFSSDKAQLDRIALAA
jgi:hypothetical protein